MSTNNHFDITNSHRTLVIPDLLGLNYWELIVSKEEPDITVFLGNIVGGKNVHHEDQILNLRNVFNYLDNTDSMLCMGYNEAFYHYSSVIKKASKIQGGYDRHLSRSRVNNFYNGIRNFFPIHETPLGVVYSNRGVSEQFIQYYSNKHELLDSIYGTVNGIFSLRPEFFEFNPHTLSERQSPFCIDRESLIKGCSKNFISSNARVQIVSGNPVKSLSEQIKDPFNPPPFIFTNTFHNREIEYLIVHNYDKYFEVKTL